MKRLVFGLMVIWVSSVFGAVTIYGWDLPLNVEVSEISFNYNTSSSDPDGITIEANGGATITAPEWSNGGQTNKKFAYLKTTSNNGPTVKAKFYCTEDGITSLMIFTVSATGSHYWYLNNTTVNFPDSIGYFTSNSLANSVTSVTEAWAWRVSKVNGVEQIPSIYIDDSYHEGYVVLQTPISPMQEPWVGVLDKACSWASGETTASSAVSDMTYELYNYGVEYDGGQHYTTDYTNLDLTSLLADLADPSSVEMDCRDFSNFLHVLTNSLGVSGKYNRIDRTTSPYWFHYNYILPSGWEHWSTSDWNYHQVGWYYNSNVADAAAKIDNDADPTQGPGDQNHVQKLVVGDMGLSDYIDKLTETPDVDSVATGICSVE
jgi:hypothetical protein